MIAFLNLLDTQAEKDDFIKLYDKYKNLLYWIAFQKTNNIETAEECVQETFFYVAKHFDKIDDVDSKRTKCYLSVIVTGFAVDVYNKSLKSDLLLNDSENINSDFFDAFNGVELSSVFDKVLDDESKTFLYLKYIYHYKSKEIADMYGVRDTYVRKKIQSAKNKLKKYLEKEGLWSEYI